MGPMPSASIRIVRDIIGATRTSADSSACASSGTDHAFVAGFHRPPWRLMTVRCSYVSPTKSFMSPSRGRSSALVLIVRTTLAKSKLFETATAR